MRPLLCKSMCAGQGRLGPRDVFYPLKNGAVQVLLKVSLSSRSATAGFKVRRLRAFAAGG